LDKAERRGATSWSGSRRRNGALWNGAIAAVVVSAILMGCTDGTTSPRAPTPSPPSLSPPLSPPPSPPPPPSSPPGLIQVLTLITYDGSGQAVHPDAVRTAAGWGGLSSSNLVVTPYPRGQASYENPSVFIGQSATVWEVPDGVQNPIAQPVAEGYLSDPDELYNPTTNELWLYYRQVTTQNQILMIRSSDGVHWSVPVTVISVPNHEAVSPTVVRMNETDWRLWAVNSGADGCTALSTTVELRTSADGIQWSAPQTVSLGDQEDFPWHMDVSWIPAYHQFWAVYNAKVAGSCTTGVLRFATSPDGIHWTTAPTPLLSRGAIPEFSDIVYRASLQYDAASDNVTLWYSGASYKTSAYEWHVAVQQISRKSMLAFVMQQPTASSSIRSDKVPVTSQPPALTNATAP